MPRKSHAFVTLTAGLLLTTGTASAQQRLALTVEKAIEIGLENSKALHSTLMKVQGADARSSEVNAARLPILRLGSNYTRLSDVPPTQLTIERDLFGPGFPPQTITSTFSPTVLNNYNLRVSLQQPLFTGFRLESSSSLANYTAQATQQDYERDRADLTYNVRSAYWNLYKANEFRKVIEENVAQMQTHLKDVQEMYTQGLLTKNEVLKVEVQLSSAEVLRIEAANNVKLATLALNNILGISLDTEIDLSSGITVGMNPRADVQELVKQALQRRPEIRGMEYRLRASEAGITLAQSGWFPQVYLTGNYYYARPNPRIFPTQDNFRDTWDVGLSLSLDLWNWGSTMSQISQAQAQLEQAKDAMGQLRDGVTLEVTQSFLNLNQSSERLTVAQKGVQQAEENYRITNEKFKAGLALNSDLLDAEVALLQAKWNRIQAMVDHALAEARLAKAVGSSGLEG